jgi:hypothetical protein
VTVEEIDRILISVASRNRNSSKSLQELAVKCKDDSPIAELHGIFNRLRPREIKWLTRLLLKNTGLVAVPADFDVSSYHSQLPNCVTVRIEIPKTNTPVLQLGSTGTLRLSQSSQRPGILSSKAINSQQQSSTSSPGAPLRKDKARLKRGCHSKRDIKNVKRDISKPRSLSAFMDGPVASVTSRSTVVNAAAAIGEIPTYQPLKRRAEVRHVSPNALTFQRGVLQPLEPNSIASDLSTGSNSCSTHSQKSAVPSGHVNFGKENSIDSSLWFSNETTQDPNGVSSGNHMSSLFDSSTLKPHEKGSRSCQSKHSSILDTNNHRLKVKNGSPPKRPHSARPVLHTPQNTEPQTLSSSMIDQTPVLRKRGKLQTPPNSRVKRPRLDDSRVGAPLQSREINSVLSSASPVSGLLGHAQAARLSSRPNISQVCSLNKLVVGEPVTHLPQSTKTSVIVSPLIRAGGESCALSTATCPLINCIFLIPPSLPSAAKNRLISNLLPLHASIYLTSIPELASPFLPRRCPVTGRKYRKIVLIEPREVEESKRILIQVERLKLTRSQNRKVWVECCDWRLLDGIAKSEQEVEGSSANLWKRYWMCAV